tara:strand:+ start:80 stop:277 length:198 start_codon:yes stop_codon:yes gene_type:complete
MSNLLGYVVIVPMYVSLLSVGVFKLGKYCERQRLELSLKSLPTYPKSKSCEDLIKKHKELLQELN